MSRTANSIQELSRAGITPTYNAATATDGNSFPNDGRTLIHVKNTGSQSVLTIRIPVTIDGQAVASSGRQVTIPATTGDKMIGPFPPEQYNQSDGTVWLDWSSVTNVTFAVVRVG